MAKKKKNCDFKLKRKKFLIVCSSKNYWKHLYKILKTSQNMVGSCLDIDNGKARVLFGPDIR